MLRRAIVALALLSGIAAVPAETPAAGDHAAYRQQILRWRAERLQRLQAPDGWLSLIGLEWLRQGDNRIGTAADNDIVLKAGPAHLGSLTLGPDGSLRMRLSPDSGASIDGKAVAAASLFDDMHVPAGATPTTVRFGHASFHVIDRDGRKALRVKDSDAAIPGRSG